MNMHESVGNLYEKTVLSMGVLLPSHVSDYFIFSRIFPKDFFAKDIVA